MISSKVIKGFVSVNDALGCSSCTTGKDHADWWFHVESITIKFIISLIFICLANNPSFQNKIIKEDAVGNVSADDDNIHTR